MRRVLAMLLVLPALVVLVENELSSISRLLNNHCLLIDKALLSKGVKR